MNNGVTYSILTLDPKEVEWFKASIWGYLEIRAPIRCPFLFGLCLFGTKKKTPHFGICPYANATGFQQLCMAVFFEVFNLFLEYFLKPMSVT